MMLTSDQTIHTYYDIHTQTYIDTHTHTVARCQYTDRLLAHE
jgi:hypothetical protein